jgi:hypothetical protein
VTQRPRSGRLQGFPRRGSAGERIRDWASSGARALRDAASTLVVHRRVVLGTLMGAQVGFTVALALSTEHNGWLYYQGGDQIWLVTTGWLFTLVEMPWAIISPGWPLVLAPITALTGPDMVAAIPPTMALNVLVLGPLATWAVYALAARIAGVGAGLWCAALWVVAPYAAIPLFVDRYHERYVEQFLPQALGLTQLADYPSMVLLLLSAALLVRSLDPGRLHEAVAAGLLAGYAGAVKPANYLFLAGAGAAFVLARRWREAVGFGLALAPAALAVLIWKAKGLGPEQVHAAAGAAVPPVASVFDRIDTLDWDSWRSNMSGLREYFWSARVLQWAPLAGAVAVARRSLPACGLLAGWLFAFVLVKGSSPVATVDSGSFFRLLMPAFPAFIVLVAAVPLLVPGLFRRLGEGIAPVATAPLGRRALVALAVVLAALPVGAVAVARPVDGPEHAIIVDEILVPVDPEAMGLRVEVTNAGNRLTWDEPTGLARLFYRVYRTRGPAADDVRCEERGATKCDLEMDVLGTARARSYLDRGARAWASYRIGAAANWEDDPAQGDVFLLSGLVPAR